MTGGKPKFAQINRGVNRNFLKLQDGKPKFSQITGGEIFHEGLKPKKSSNYKDEIQKKYFTEMKTENDLYYRGKALLTLD